jgi:hypothetical protein
MKNKALYEKTVSILVDAYMNDTLVHGNCAACAVGNICGAYGFPEPSFPFYEGPTRESWSELFYTASTGQFINASALKDPNVMKVINATGYHWKQLAQIERAFEMAPRGSSSDEWMFNGLMAVVEVLDLIHENIDPAVTESSKKRFVKA